MIEESRDKQAAKQDHRKSCPQLVHIKECINTNKKPLHRAVAGPTIFSAAAADRQGPDKNRAMLFVKHHWPCSLHHGALHIDHEPVVHVVLRQAVVRLVDVIRINQLDVRHDVVLPAEVLRRQESP